MADKTAKYRTEIQQVSRLERPRLPPIVQVFRQRGALRHASWKWPTATAIFKPIIMIMTSYKAHSADTIIQMMYVSGETAEASAETTGMIEEIVRQQVIEMVCLAD
jgi:hypothetical protein